MFQFSAGKRQDNFWSLCAAFFLPPPGYEWDELELGFITATLLSADQTQKHSQGFVFGVDGHNFLICLKQFRINYFISNLLETPFRDVL